MNSYQRYHARLHGQPVNCVPNFGRSRFSRKDAKNAKAGMAVPFFAVPAPLREPDS
jgi:hypothetical protein